MKLPYQFDDINSISLKKNQRGTFTYEIEGTYKGQKVKLLAENVSIYQEPIKELRYFEDRVPLEFYEENKGIVSANLIGLVFCPYNYTDGRNDEVLFTFTVEER